MNRSELVAALADRAEVTRKDADAVLAALAETVGEVVAKGDEKVTIPGFLTFERTHRAARTARNPQTGDPIKISERRVLTFKASNILKQALNPKREGTKSDPAGAHDGRFDNSRDSGSLGAAVPADVVPSTHNAPAPTVVTNE